MPAALVVLKLRSIRGVDFSHGQTSEDRRLANYPPTLSPAVAGLGGGCMLGLFFLTPGWIGCEWGNQE